MERQIRHIESRVSLYKDFARVRTVTPAAVLYFLDSDCPGRKIWTVDALLYETSGRRVILDMLAINTLMVKGVDRTVWHVDWRVKCRGGQRQEQTHNFKLVPNILGLGNNSAVQYDTQAVVGRCEVRDENKIAVQDLSSGW